ncbi:hypothetical protein IZ6_23600 [Terrihabitans soli]|uniref:Flagellin n=1 Tax=Terrihabitans soli TaxID=708113 RepID=A0A6S6QVL6_9HYPH|nr:flagellin [Terrihabitans soli]BCJ91625.1 hypothetical protein IZ6_23600 [Terrihabitans soli]
MASNITLSAGVRQNLLSLQNTANLMSTTQNRLATGKKVNSALDNPTSFFTAQSLQSRASDMASLLDGMTSGVKTLEAADNGLSAITKTVESMQSTLRQARQDKSFKTESYTLGAGLTAAQDISFEGGAVGTTPVSITLGTAAVGATPATVTGAGGGDWDTGTTVFEATNGGGEYDGETITITAENGDTDSYTIQAGDTVADIVAELSDGDFTVTGTNVGFNFSHAGGSDFTVTTSLPALTTAAGVGTTATSVNGVPAVAAASKSVDTLVSEINANVSLQGKVRASNDGGKLRIENLSTSELTVTGVNSTTGTVDGSAGEGEVGGNTVRQNLVKQFNELRDQLDKLADDASYNGVNLLRGDKLKLTFNETGTSTIEIQAKDEAGEERAINSTTLGIDTATDADFDNDAGIDGILDGMKDALGVLRAQSSSFGSNLSIVENRTEFTKSMINTLQTGADSLVLADTNEEAANMLALQTRQQLSSTALSLASQADQAVLRLF